METWKKFDTNRGKPDLLYDGFQYKIHREAKSSRTWRCTKNECKATCTTDLSDLMVLDGHSSITILSQMRSSQRHKGRQESKLKASDEMGERPNKIIMTEIAKQDTTDLLQSDVKSVRQGICRRRRKTQAEVERRNERGVRSV